MIKSIAETEINVEGINTIIKSLTTFAIRDLIYIADVDAVLAIFTVASCLIDQLGGIMNGGKSTGRTYQKFIERYMPKYDKHKLYSDLRCALVHNFSIGRDFLLDRSVPEFHLQLTQQGKTIINIQSFVTDIEIGFNEFINDLHNDERTRISASNWLKKYNIIVMATLNTNR